MALLCVAAMLFVYCHPEGPAMLDALRAWNDFGEGEPC